MRGCRNYHAGPTNNRAIQAFHAGSSPRCRKDRTTWERVQRPAADRLSKPDSLYSWPEARFAVTHTRWEPYARIGNVRISAGALGNERPCRVLR